MYFNTGSLLKTIIPKRRVKKWINIKAIDKEDASGNYLSGNRNVNFYDSFHPVEDTSSHMNYPSNDEQQKPTLMQNNASRSIPYDKQIIQCDLHTVCFINDDLCNIMNIAKRTIQTVFSDAKMHDYPYNAQNWPMQLVSNLRDAALVSVQFPDIYKPKDILLFLHYPKHQNNHTQEGYSLAGYALECIDNAKRSGSSIELYYSSQTIQQKEIKQYQANENTNTCLKTDNVSLNNKINDIQSDDHIGITNKVDIIANADIIDDIDVIADADVIVDADVIINADNDTDNISSPNVNDITQAHEEGNVEVLHEHEPEAQIEETQYNNMTLAVRCDIIHQISDFIINLVQDQSTEQNNTEEILSSILKRIEVTTKFISNRG